MPGLLQTSANPASFTVFGGFVGPVGWGFTSSTVTSPGPDLTVATGETVTMSLTSADGAPHNWGVDYDGNGFIDAGEPISSNFPPTTSLTFTATTTPGTYTYWCFIHKGPMFGRFIVQAPATPDFSISASATTPASLVAGNSATSTISLTSLNNFAGSVNLAASSTAPVAGLTFSFSVNPVTLTAGGTGTSTLTISTTASTPAGTYTIAVTGTSGSLSHPATVAVTVVGTDFSMSSSPTTLSIVQGSSGNSTITLTSLNGFSGSVTLSVAVSPTGPTASLSPIFVALSSGGTGTAVLRVSTSSGAYSSTATGSYTITLTGTSGSLSHSVSLSITIQPSSGGNNALVPILIGAVAVAIVVAGALFYLTRRSRLKK